MFRNKYETKKRVRKYCNSGSEVFERKGWIYDDGELVWVTKEVVPMYAEIQAQKDLVELHAILKRFEDGDDSALNKVEGMYMDTVDLPKNYAELYSAVNRANDVFYSMPTEIKEKYSNNPAKFWRNYGTAAFDDLMNAYRAEVYGEYGQVDPSPINSVKDMENDRQKVEKAFADDRKAMEGEKNNE